MSRIRPFPVPPRPRLAAAVLGVAAFTATCGSVGPAPEVTAPEATASEVTAPEATASEVTAPEVMAPGDRVAPLAPGPASVASVDDVPAMFREAVAAVFRRRSGAVDRESWIVEQGVRVSLFVELRWAGDRGTVRRRLHAEGDGLDTPEGRALADSLQDIDDERAVGGEELRRLLSDSRSEMVDRLRPVGPALRERGDGWWRAIGGGGFLDVGVRLTAHMVDRLEYAFVGTAGDYWDVVG